MVDSTLQLMSNYLKFRLKLVTPFPIYNVDESPETNAFNAGVHFGIKNALEVLSSFKTAEELSEYMISVETAMDEV